MTIFQIYAIIILLLFYGSFFIKMLLQNRIGIKTNQMARGNKPLRTYRIELIMRAATFMTAVVQLGSVILADKGLIVSGEVIRYIGALLALLGVLVFVVAMVTMRSSWRAGINTNEKTEMVTAGIYRFSRNPAFVGFDLFYIGSALLFCNLFNVVFAILSIIMLHLQILEEEKYLPTVFGTNYLEYKMKTARYFLFL